MDILGIGFAELIFILVIAMMVFGPKRLPEIAAKAGKIMGDLRNMSRGLMNEWQREITIASRLEDFEKAREELGQVKKDLQQAHKTVSRESSQAAKSAASTVDEAVKANSSASSEPKQASTVSTASPVETADNTSEPETPQPEIRPPTAPNTTPNDQKKPAQTMATNHKSTPAVPASDSEKVVNE